MRFRPALDRHLQVSELVVEHRRIETQRVGAQLGFDACLIGHQISAEEQLYRYSIEAISPL
jgi:hypothetical protein